MKVLLRPPVDLPEERLPTDTGAGLEHASKRLGDQWLAQLGGSLALNIVSMGKKINTVKFSNRDDRCAYSYSHPRRSETQPEML